jgi:hypothetical protein
MTLRLVDHFAALVVLSGFGTVAWSVRVERPESDSGFLSVLIVYMIGHAILFGGLIISSIWWTIVNRGRNRYSHLTIASCSVLYALLPIVMWKGAAYFQPVMMLVIIICLWFAGITLAGRLGLTLSLLVIQSAYSILLFNSPGCLADNVFFGLLVSGTVCLVASFYYCRLTSCKLEQSLPKEVAAVSEP